MRDITDEICYPTREKIGFEPTPENEQIIASILADHVRQALNAKKNKPYFIYEYIGDAQSILDDADEVYE